MSFQKLIKMKIQLTINFCNADQTIISYSDKGFYDGIQKWGNFLTTHYGKEQNRRERNFSKFICYISYV